MEIYSSLKNGLMIESVEKVLSKMKKKILNLKENGMMEKLKKEI